MAVLSILKTLTPPHPHFRGPAITIKNVIEYVINIKLILLEVPGTTIENVRDYVFNIKLLLSEVPGTTPPPSHRASHSGQ